MIPPWVFVAHITLIVGFVLFAILHIAWLIYVWRLDYKWRYAQALQRECGKNGMERETIRWNMNQVFNNDRTLKSLKDYSITLVSIYPITFIIAAKLIIPHYNKSFVPLTNFAFLEKLQNLPTHLYYNAVAVLLLFITMGVIAKYFGSNPRKNKLKDLMRPYTMSLDNVEKTLRLIKNRAARGSTQFDHEQELQERIAKRIAIVNNAESNKMGKALMDSMDPKEWIGYLQFSEDTASTALCRYVKEDVEKFNSSETTAFKNSVTAFDGSESGFNTLQNTLKAAFPASTYPYFNKYITTLKQENIGDFIATWRNSDNSFRLIIENDKFKSDEDLWNNTITPKICQYWDATWGWDNKLKEVTYGDPSRKLKPMMRQLKIYFGITFIFILSIIYMYVPKGPLLPFAFAALLLVFVFAYLTQFI